MANALLYFGLRSGAMSGKRAMMSATIFACAARSFALAARFRQSVRAGDRVDDPSAFYERARALGLYRP